MDARRIAGLLADGHDVRVGLDMGCILHEDKAQADVIAEWKGAEYPDRYIVVGGHLDSWDIGEGAHGGAGIVTALRRCGRLRSGCLTAAHPEVVLFINEENGNNGANLRAQSPREG